jgi:HPt (histidine-containing phosphotransfer) domain-containing protein
MTATDDALPIIDPGVIQGLRNELGDDAQAVIDDIVAGFRADGAGQVVAVGQAPDALELAKRAHKLRGSALNLGAARLATLCGRIEAEAKAGRLAEAKALVPGVAPLFALTCAALA